jgi:two-component system chemotaxis response regulator CheY
MGGDRSMTTILYVEDNPEHRLMMHTLLTSYGFDVEMARNGIEGMEVIREVPPDLILTDLYMPKMDGFAFIEQVKRIPTTQDIPIIVVSAWPTGDHRQRAFECGALGFVDKPYDTDALVDLIKENLHVRA